MSENKRIISYSSDKNGCGMYRSIVPFTYLSTKLDWDSTFMYQFVFDLNLIRSSHWIRMQRQCTANQVRCVQEYRNCIDKTNSPARVAYELDDLVHAIEPHNALAYQFYTPSRRQNVVDIMRLSHKVTFSTQFLKDFYGHNFGIQHSYVIPNFLPKFLWNPTWADKSPHGKKPTIMYAGSASHFGPGGDLETLLPMIDATRDEFDWLFVGCVPPSLQGRVRFINWVGFWEYPALMQSIKADLALGPITDSIFNMAKSDLKYKETCAMNIPFLGSSIGNGAGPYDLAGCKNLVKSNDPDSWYSAIKELLSNESKKAETLKYQQAFVNKHWLENDENVGLYQHVYG